MDVKSCSQIESDRMVEIIKNQLYFAVIKGLSGKKIKSTTDALYFSIDDEFDYQNFYYDFGPYNISHLYKYCMKLNKYLQYSQGQKRVVHCTSTNPEKRVNAAYLIGAYCIIFLKFHPATVTKILAKAGPYKQFLDASQIPCPYTLKINVCFNAIAKAIAFNFFNFDDFDMVEYDMYEKFQFGDMNWLVPRKFLAFIGPNNKEFLNGHPPNYYLKYFLKNDVKTVIRLNNKMYDSAIFKKAGIDHHDLIFPDGSTPSREILLKFLEISEASPGAIAVHCKAGLGRTGSLIGAYIIKHYKMTAKEAIAWMRICRPGSVIGQQQMWLEKLELWLWKCGEQFRYKHYGDGDKIPRHKFGIYSKIWPVERSKIIREIRRKCTSNYSVSDPENLANNRKYGTLSKNKPQRLKMKCLKEKSCFEDISQFLTSVYGLDKMKTRQQNLTMPNITVLNAEETQKPIMSLKNYKVNPIRPHIASGETSSANHNQLIESQGDNEYSENENRRDIPLSVRSFSPTKIDRDTDTTNTVHSYMEEMNKKKAMHSQSLRLTQGDKLMERKLQKFKRKINPRNLSNEDIKEDSNTDNSY